MAGDSNAEIPESGAVFTFGRSRFANNAASHFFIRNDPVVEMSCGDEHTAVVCQNGRVFAFGNNSWGQLGLGHKNTATMPSCVKSLKPEKATHVACGKSHTIISTFSGKVFAFGSNMDCQLGVGDTEERVSPEEVPGLFTGEDGVRMLAAGCQHSAVLTVDGGVYVWGSNADGQLGLGDSVTVVDTPKRIDIPHTIAYISCGYYHTALVTEDGKLLMCGEGENGKLGLSRENRNIFVPTPVNINVPIRSVACGGNHTIAVSMDGDVYGFGSNLSGQLGLGREVLSFSVPECIETLLGKHVCAAACGEIHSAFLTVEGHMYACGDGRHGKLCVDIENGDDGTVQCTPQFVSRFSQYRVKQVACGGCHTMVQAVLEVDASKGDSDRPVNGDVSLRLQNAESNDNEKTSALPEGQNRVLPPLQNAPALNGFPEKTSKREIDMPQNLATETAIETTQSTVVREAREVAEKEYGRSDQGSQAMEQNVETSRLNNGNRSLDDEEEQPLTSQKDFVTVVNGNHKMSADQQNAELSNTDETLATDSRNDLFSKFNLRDASDLTNDYHDSLNERDEEEVEENSDTPRTVEAENDEEYIKTLEGRRCSVDVTPTLTDGVDLDNEEVTVTGEDKSISKPNIMANIDKGEGKMAKFFNAFRRKKLSEENVSVNKAWTDDNRRISSENNLKNGKSSQSQIKSGQVHRSKACTIL
ncbi:X-linked retinitis pigmentosa GTPase regulator-like isoform X2 [Frankliniella occidentalis]|uniref:X-linked retinitis pigmentosa GTPase regulator-like isoform X2 n=1 Tax=Frankliniella occidentalis TaxID=133901 RepID=A0A9C6WVL3_FRAOC|nr:X-linked retinitis pigmentosa GTPase regulator-like isoform X2 [Frankliniella occidentalis]